MHRRNRSHHGRLFRNRRLILSRLHQEEEQPPLVWLRIVPAASANSQSAGSYDYPQLMAIENHARQQNEQRWRTAFENSAIGITMADFTGHLFAANCTFLNMLGYTVFPAFTRLLYWC